MALVELRRPALCLLSKLVVVTCALIDGFRKRVNERGKELARRVSEGDEQSVVHGMTGVVDHVDRPEVGVEDPVNRFEIGHRNGLPVGEDDCVFSETATELQLKCWRDEIEIAAASKCLASDAVRIPK